ncbi:MAG TPA: hypothetical protein VKB49_15180 [Candidatus Sulfotelmatobacter sp.]|nr:hypothetical protein [Candidatus Sulfotelmatobacter sp.]
MTFLSVQIVRLVDDSFPGWVDCEFTDARARHHTITEKYAVLTHKMLDADSEYPTRGSMPCEVLHRYQNENGRACVRITTDKPLSIESNEGVSEFEVPEELVSSAPDSSP